MSLTPGALTYTPDSYQKDSVGYSGALRTASVKDDITLSRVLPKPTSVFSGVLRTRMKLTRTYTLTGALTPTGDIIAEINVSVPVGMSSTDVQTVKTLIADMTADADFLTLLRDGKITY
jgi:hypothetical protein